MQICSFDLKKSKPQGQKVVKAGVGREREETLYFCESDKRFYFLFKSFKSGRLLSQISYVLEDEEAKRLARGAFGEDAYGNVLECMKGRWAMLYDESEFKFDYKPLQETSTARDLYYYSPYPEEATHEDKSLLKDKVLDVAVSFSEYYGIKGKHFKVLVQAIEAGYALGKRDFALYRKLWCPTIHTGDTVVAKGKHGIVVKTDAGILTVVNPLTGTFTVPQREAHRIDSKSLSKLLTADRWTWGKTLEALF